PVGKAERLARWGRRNPRLALVSAALFAALLCIAVGSVVAAGWYSAQRNRPVELAASIDQARQVADEARTDALRKLEASYLAQAQARRRSAEPGQRYASLAALREAASLAKQLGLSEEHLLDLRNEAIAAIGLPVDLRLAARWPAPGPKGGETNMF